MVGRVWCCKNRNLVFTMRSRRLIPYNREVDDMIDPILCRPPPEDPVAFVTQFISSTRARSLRLRRHEFACIYLSCERTRGVLITCHGAWMRARARVRCHETASLAPRVALFTNFPFISLFGFFMTKVFFPNISPFACERAAAGRPRKDSLS